MVTFLKEDINKGGYSCATYAWAILTDFKATFNSFWFGIFGLSVALDYVQVKIDIFVE